MAKLIVIGLWFTFALLMIIIIIMIIIINYPQILPKHKKAMSSQLFRYERLREMKDDKYNKLHESSKQEQSRLEKERIKQMNDAQQQYKEQLEAVQKKYDMQEQDTAQKFKKLRSDQKAQTLKLQKYYNELASTDRDRVTDQRLKKQRQFNELNFQYHDLKKQKATEIDELKNKLLAANIQVQHLQNELDTFKNKFLDLKYSNIDI